MIAKHVAMRSVRMSAFSKLVDYITNAKDRLERVGEVTITNCHSLDPAVAAKEAEAVQKANLLSSGDKTYHLIVSFPPGEQPDGDVLRKIEAEICKALGFQDHQRVSAVHHDTDCLHIHMAINKVNPNTGTVHSPYNDYKTLGKVCEKLEQEFSLQQVDHQSRKRTGEGRASDMEAMAGVESLISWARETCVPELLKAQSWNEVHTILGFHDLEMRARGNGLIIVAKEDGTSIRASSASRSLSKDALEKRLGVFEPDPNAVTTPKAAYSQRPVKGRVDTGELYQRYRKDMSANTGGRKEALEVAKAKREIAHEKISKAVRSQRERIRTITSPLLRKLSFAAINYAQRNARDAVRSAYANERKRIDQAFRRTAWLDWLKGQAEGGNAEALVALRGRQGRRSEVRDAFVGEGAVAFAGARVDTITKAGTIIYATKDVAVRDEGSRLHLSRGADEQAIIMALKIARDRFGDTLLVEGSGLFQARVATLAAQENITINLTEPKDDHGRTGQELRRVAGGGGAGGEPRADDRADRPQRREPSRGGERGRYDAWRAGQDRGGRRAANGASARPDLAEIGRDPPPEARNRVRNLSELNVARFGGEPSLLLSRHVRADMANRGAGGNRDVRRPVHNLNNESLTVLASSKYVAEREAKRQSGFSIAKHRLFDGEVGSVEYAGRRSIDGVNLLLLRQKDEIMVMPANAKTAARVSRLNIGAKIELAEGGRIITKGRGR